MNSIFFQPSQQNFSGLISTCQGFCDEFLYIDISEVYNEYFDKKYAFDFSKGTTATKDSEGWISFSLKEKYFYITHYELQQRTNSQDNLMEIW